MHTVQGDYENPKSKTQKNAHRSKGAIKNSTMKLSAKYSYNQCHLHSFRKVHTVQGGYKNPEVKLRNADCLKGL